MKSKLSLNRVDNLQSHQNYRDSRPYCHKYAPVWCKTHSYISILRVLLSFDRIELLLFCHILRVGLSFPLHSMNLRMGNECGVFHARMCIPFLWIDEFRKLLFFLMVMIFSLLVSFYYLDIDCTLRIHLSCLPCYYWWLGIVCLDHRFDN